MLSSSCSAPPNAACDTCARAYFRRWSSARRAGAGTGVPHRLVDNDKKTSLAGMQILRASDALKAEGVSVVASWNQSNWPGLARGLAPGIVRTASAQDKSRMCRLWAREHTYQSWPVLLGCPGIHPRENEPPCGNLAGVFGIPCATIDFTSDPTVAGAVYDDKRWFRITHSQHPPELCKAKKVVKMDKVGVAMSVYPTALGHFVPEQLPNVLLLHAHLPNDVPILVADSPVTRRYLQPIINDKRTPPNRFSFQKLSGDGTVIKANMVYTVVNSHFSNIMNGDVSYRTARTLLQAPIGGHLPHAKRTDVMLIDRGAGKSRSARNAREVHSALEQVIAEYAARASAAKATTGKGHGSSTTRRLSALSDAAASSYARRLEVSTRRSNR